jgi:hypothetical protein
MDSKVAQHDDRAHDHAARERHQHLYRRHSSPPAQTIHDLTVSNIRNAL